MFFPAVTPLINLLGFVFGAALYALLLVIVIRHPVKKTVANGEDAAKFSFDWLLLATGVLGLLWNLGGLFEWLSRDLLDAKFHLLFLAAAYSALGFLPAVVVHSVLRESDEDEREGGANAKIRLLMISAYGLSAIAAVWHFYHALSFAFAPSYRALQLLTCGYLIILALLLLSSLRQSVGRKAIWATALAVFAVSALHLSRPHAGENSWAVEIAGHQAALPLALAILYQDFRFAFADLFLKRFFSLLFVAAATGGFYFFVVAPLFSDEAIFIARDAKFIAVNLGFWTATAFVYPQINRLSEWLVNRVILRRVGYERLQTKIMGSITGAETVQTVLENVCGELKIALTASRASWQKSTNPPNVYQSFVNPKRDVTEILIPTTDQPGYKITLENFKGGRRLLSDEIEMLGDAALQTARRIDALRVTHERCEQELREQEFSKLATEAELRALRAQINPHFLFNALTTISYLINTAPEKANETLMRLTKLLRGVLRSTDEFLTLGDEIALIESYLEIERARFEERLTIEIDIAPELLPLRVPSLILQPLVENAVKHGITPKKTGGCVRIEATRRAGNLILKVSDTGMGVSDLELRQRREQRIGLNNVEDRLRLYFNDAASLTVESRIGMGTAVEIKINLDCIAPLALRRAIAA